MYNSKKISGFSFGKIIYMKRLIYFFVFLFFITVSAGSQQLLASLEKLNWLEGDWIRTNTKPGRSGSEHWQKISATEWQGTGITMKGTDTSFVEKLKLVANDGAIFYVADVTGNNGQVFFKFTRFDENGFTCENPRHDFPKKIDYQRNGNSLKATISGDGKSIEYLFEKK